MRFLSFTVKCKGAVIHDCSFYLIVSTTFSPAFCPHQSNLRAFPWIFLLKVGNDFHFQSMLKRIPHWAKCVIFPIYMHNFPGGRISDLLKILLNILGWYWLTKLYRFQLYSSVIHHLYIVLCVHHPKSSLLPCWSHCHWLTFQCHRSSFLPLALSPLCPE